MVSTILRPPETEESYDDRPWLLPRNKREGEKEKEAVGMLKILGFREITVQGPLCRAVPPTKKWQKVPRKGDGNWSDIIDPSGTIRFSAYIDLGNHQAYILLKKGSHEQ